MSFSVCFSELFSVCFFFCSFFFNDFFVFAAADGFVAGVFVSEAFVFAAVAAAVTFESNLEILLEYSVYNNNKSSDADERADNDENTLQRDGGIFFFHSRISFHMGNLYGIRN